MLSALFAPAAAGASTAETPAPATIVWLWPCNVDAWNHWIEVQTQWRTGGVGGATGLDYGAVCAYLREVVARRKPRAEVFAGIRAAERATLEVWAQQREDKKRDC